MWQLRDEEGKLIKTLQPTAWSCCRGLYRANGSPIHRKQTLGIDHDFTVYNKKEVVEYLKVPEIEPEEQRIIGESKVPSVKYIMVPYSVEKV